VPSFSFASTSAVNMLSTVTVPSPATHALVRSASRAALEDPFAGASGGGASTSSAARTARRAPGSSPSTKRPRGP